MGERSFKILRELVIWATVLLSVSALSVGQNAPAPQLANASSDGGDDLQAQIRALQISVARMQSRIDSMQAETEKLRAELRDTRARLSALDFSPKPPSGSSSGSRAASLHEPCQSDELAKADNNLQNRLSNLEEEQQLLKSKVDDQYQTKVESASNIAFACQVWPCSTYSAIEGALITRMFPVSPNSVALWIPMPHLALPFGNRWSDSMFPVPR